MSKKPKFSIGDTVFAKVSTQGSYEPSHCRVGEKMKVKEIRECGNTFEYTCGYDGYILKENELMSKKEFIKSL